MATLQSRNVQQKIADLQRLHVALNEMIIQCNGEGFSIDDCPIIDARYVVE